MRRIAERSSKGFTLVELVIVIAIIGVLAAIAIPWYMDYVVRGRLAEGMSLLSELQLRQEQAYQDNRAYVNNMTPRQTAQYWNATCTTAAGGQTFTCTATPIASFEIGYVYRVDQAGAKSTAATTPPVSGWVLPATTTCWIKTLNGRC